MAEVNPVFAPDFQEHDAQVIARQTKITRTIEAVRLGLTTLALLAGTTIVGVSADILSVYNMTHLSEDFLLPLWPTNFNIRPSIALVTCGVIVLVASAVSLTASKIPSVRIAN